MLCDDDGEVEEVVDWNDDDYFVDNRDWLLQLVVKLIVLQSEPNVVIVVIVMKIMMTTTTS